MFPPAEDGFKQNVLRAKYQCKIWCESHIANPEVAHIMYTQESAPVELRDTSWYISTAKMTSALMDGVVPVTLLGSDALTYVNVQTAEIRTKKAWTTKLY